VTEAVAPPGRDVEVVTFGCRLNAYESEVIRARAAADGLEDAVVFNTCAVTGEAVRQARQAIRRARRERPGARLIVTGCAAQIDPAGFADLAEVDLVLGQAEKVRPGAYAPDPLESRVRVNDVMSVRETAGHLIDGLQDRARAYVEVQNGCDHRCTFCVIPYGRGNSRSAAAGDIVEQIRRLAAGGCREVVLTGVDISAWGADLPGAPTLGGLVTRILRLVPELERLRLSSIDAAEIDAELLRCFAEEPRLMPHLHLSLQAGDDMILKRMKRRHSREQSLRLVEQVRAVRPDTAFGADLIAGFPTETEEMFENTLALVDDANLAFLHVFPFSPRPGTPAARMPQLARPSGQGARRAAARAGEAALRRTSRPSTGGGCGPGGREGAGAGGGFHRARVWRARRPPGGGRVAAAGHDGRRAIARSADGYRRVAWRIELAHDDAFAPKKAGSSA
jgi:threonylcarbamoyladenosine tRNA methylthiotransferase MtaB